MRRSFPLPVALPFLMMLGGALLQTPASASDLPAGKGRETLKRVCTSCHDLDVTAGMRSTRAGWSDIVRSMKEMGAEASPAEFSEIIDYLSSNFGKQAGSDKKTSVDASAHPVTRRALPWEKSRLNVGRALYRENCVVCHDVDAENSAKAGPSFYHLFQREKMPSGNAKPSGSYVAAKIRAGGKLMPAFGKTLSAGEIDSVIEYMQSK